MAISQSFHLSVGIFFAILSCTSTVELDVDSQPVIHLSHAVGSSGRLEPRGQINIRSMKTGSVVIQNNAILDPEDIKKAAEANEFYHLEAAVKSSAGDRVFLTSTKACLLYESQLSDIITVHVDLLGTIYGISISTSNNQCGGDNFLAGPNLDSFNSTVMISYMEQGPIPDVAMYIQKVEQEKIAKERGETKDNRSFIAKYWMYILPVVVVFMISGANNPEQGGGSR